MAKKPSVSLMSSVKSSLSSVGPEVRQTAVAENHDNDLTKSGRPRTLKPGFKTLTLRISPETHKALNVLAAQEGITAKQILFNGLADQFSRYGVTAPVE